MGFLINYMIHFAFNVPGATVWWVILCSVPLCSFPDSSAGEADLWLPGLSVGAHPGQFFTHYGCHPGHLWDHPVQIQIPHNGRYCKANAPCPLIDLLHLQHSAWLIPIQQVIKWFYYPEDLGWLQPAITVVMIIITGSDYAKKKVSASSAWKGRVLHVCTIPALICPGSCYKLCMGLYSLKEGHRAGTQINRLPKEARSDSRILSAGSQRQPLISCSLEPNQKAPLYLKGFLPGTV